MTDAEILRQAADEIRAIRDCTDAALNHRTGAAHHAAFWATEAAGRYEKAAELAAEMEREDTAA